MDLGVSGLNQSAHQVVAMATSQGLATALDQLVVQIAQDLIERSLPALETFVAVSRYM